MREVRTVVNFWWWGGHKGHFWDSGHGLYIVPGSVYTGIFICKTVLGFIIKMCEFYFKNIYKDKTKQRTHLSECLVEHCLGAGVLHEL